MRRLALAFAISFVACERESSPPPQQPMSGYAPPQEAAPAPPPPGCNKPPPRSGVLHIPIFGKNRSYVLSVPNGYQPSTTYPIVFGLHGNGGSGANAQKSLDLEQVAQGKAIFVYPDAIGGGWDLDSPAAKNADVALFDGILAVTQSALCVDLRRVFVTGFSNGAYMANQLGCRRGSRIRAVASHAGGGPYETQGSYDAEGHLVCPEKAVASLVVHGLGDGTVSPSEGQKSIDHWTSANRCSGGGGPINPPGCVAFSGCAQPVVACKVQGLGHGVWPQAKALTWGFFDAQR